MQRTENTMTQALPLALALMIGGGAAVQTAMLSSIGRQRGPAEAGWQSILATVVGVALILAVRSLRGDAPALPAPLDRAPVQLAVAAVAATGLVFTVRGLEPYYLIVGFFGLAFIVGAAALTPKLGIALFLSATIAGQLVGALVLDQIGAFGNPVHSLNLARAAGVGALLAGVVLVRGAGR
ncbi:MAG: DMT family transporter [Dehalococcoidia bacterium]